VAYKQLSQQELLHAYSAVSLLNAFNVSAPLPCQYNFRATNISEAVSQAGIFTQIVLGALQSVAVGAASNNDSGVIGTLTSIIAEEGQQDGFYQTAQTLIPFGKPFVTASTGPYIFSYVLNNYVVPNSCPFNVSDLGIPTFPPLSVNGSTIVSNVQPMDQMLTFSANLSSVTDAGNFTGSNGNGLFITYLPGQYTPISVPVANFTSQNDLVTFKANFSYVENIMDGLTLAALTTMSNFTSPDDMPAATLAGPGVINVVVKF